MKLADLQEAKYAGSFSEDEIYHRYRDVTDNLRRDRDRVMMAGSSEWSGIDGVVMDVLLANSFLSRGEAKRFIRDTLRAYSLPYTSMTAEYEDDETIRVQVTYKSLQEAKYAEPEVKRLKGVLYVDDDQRGEWIKHRHVKISVRCDSSATTKSEYSHSYDCEIVSADNPSTLVDIKPGDRAWFTRDKRGWVLGEYDGKWNLADR